MIEIGRERFEALVADALDQVPPELSNMMDNVAVFVVDDPPGSDRHLLGLYEGIPLTARDSSYGMGSMPDRISIFRGPILAICANEHDVTDQVRITVVHEIAHHFGIDDERLHELGYG